jgi:hypothetical protein
MKYWPKILLVILLCSLFLGAKRQSGLTLPRSKPNTELKFLDLKYKKEITDKKISNSKKYLLTVLAAREFSEMHFTEKSLEYYKIAKEIKVDENKNEVNLALANQNFEVLNSPFFFDVNIKQLLKSKNYEKILLSLNPKKLNDKGNENFKIMYDLLNVKIKKRSVRKLYCFENLQKNPEDYQYENLICDLLENYLKEGKLTTDRIHLIEEYFVKHDLKEQYLLYLTKELKATL